MSRTNRLGNLVSGARTLLGIISGRRVFGGPRSIALILSSTCNSACVMCWFHSPLLASAGLDAETSDPQRPPFMDFALCEAIIRESRELGTHRVVLGGHGEPTLHPRFDDLLDLVAGLGMLPYVLTNGLAVDLGRAREWASRRAHYRFSVHAGDVETWLRVHPRGSAEQFRRLEGVLGCLAASDRAQVSTMHVLQKDNFRNARRMVEHAGSLGIREVQFFPVRIRDLLTEVLPDPEAEEELRGELRACERLAATYGIRTNLREFPESNHYTRSGVPETAALYRRIPCYVGWLYAEFDVDGSMRPCENSSIVLGRAGSQSVREMWNSPRYDEFRREGRAMPRSNTPVTGCPCDACCMPKFNINVHNLLRLRSLRYGEP